MLVIKNQIKSLPWHKTKKWSKRSESVIKTIIVHQELGSALVKNVNNYHISPNHISKTGCPHFCYHFGIEKDGTVIQANELTDITWHTKGMNTVGVGIMLVGDFSGAGHYGKDNPTKEQLESLGLLLDKLRGVLNISKSNIKGHSDYGKPACPGIAVMNFLNGYKSKKQ